MPKRIFPAVEVPAGSASCALHPFLSLPLHSQASFPPSPRPTLRGILGPVIMGIFIYLTRGAQLLKEVQKSDFVLQQLCVSVGSAYKAHVPRSGVPLSAGGGWGAGDILPLFPLQDAHPGPLSAGASFTLTIKPDVQGHLVNASS